MEFEGKKSTFARTFTKSVLRLKTNTVDTLSYKTKSTRKEDVERKWYIVDAEGETVGRICSKIAHVLKGKHKPSYTPHVDCGDHVIVVNADKIRFTGKKLAQKAYLYHTGYPGGQRRIVAGELLSRKPHQVVEKVSC